MRLDEICNLKKTDIHENCIHIYKGKTKSSTRVIPVHYLLKDLLHLLNLKSKDGYIITDLCPGGYDDKRSANFQKKLKRLRDKLELPKGVVFHSLRNTFSTRMENLGIPSNHLSQLMGHEDGNMALDVYSGGLAIEPLRESISKLTYGTEVDSLAKNSIDKISANT